MGGSAEYAVPSLSFLLTEACCDMISFWLTQWEKNVITTSSDSECYFRGWRRNERALDSQCQGARLFLTPAMTHLMIIFNICFAFLSFLLNPLRQWIWITSASLGVECLHGCVYLGPNLLLLILPATSSSLGELPTLLTSKAINVPRLKVQMKGKWWFTMDVGQ